MDVVIAFTLLCSIGFLFDGFRRINKLIVEGECINKNHIIIISIAYIAEVIQSLSFIFRNNKIQPNVDLTKTIILDCSFFVA